MSLITNKDTQKLLTTSAIGALTVVIITIIASEFGELDLIPDLWAGLNLWSILIIIALILISKANKGLNYNSGFAWGFLTYIIGKIIGLVIVAYFFDTVSDVAVNYSYSAFSYGEGMDYAGETISKFMNLLSKIAMQQGLIINIISALYKGIVVGLIIGAISPKDTK